MMEKAALEYLVDEVSKPHLDDIGGETYSDKPLHRIKHNPLAESIHMNTLTGLVDYIKSETDKMSKKMLVHVESPTEVYLESMLDEERKREIFVNATAMVPYFEFGGYINNENFCISLQSKFIQTKDRDLVLKFAGTVEDGTVAEYGDDGVTQKATVRTGIASKTDAKVPNPVHLKPYRTFLEVDQPASDFVFRMRSERGVECAIFEADGGAWKYEAMQNIKKYLKEQLRNFDGLTVVS